MRIKTSLAEFLASFTKNLCDFEKIRAKNAPIVDFGGGWG